MDSQHNSIKIVKQIYLAMHFGISPFFIPQNSTLVNTKIKFEFIMRTHRICNCSKYLNKQTIHKFSFIQSLFSKPYPKENRFESIGLISLFKIGSINHEAEKTFSLIYY